MDLNTRLKLFTSEEEIENCVVITLGCYQSIVETITGGYKGLTTGFVNNGLFTFERDWNNNKKLKEVIEKLYNTRKTSEKQRAKIKNKDYFTLVNILTLHGFDFEQFRSNYDTVILVDLGDDL